MQDNRRRPDVQYRQMAVALILLSILVAITLATLFFLIGTHG